MSYHEVPPQWVAKKYKGFFDALPKYVDIKLRERLATRSTLAVIKEYKNTIPLDEFVKPQLKDFIKMLNYHGPIFHRSGNNHLET